MQELPTISFCNLKQTPPFVSVFQAVVSKHILFIQSLNPHSFMQSITASDILTAVPLQSLGTDNSFTKFCPETRIGSRPTFFFPGLVKSSIIFPSQCNISGTTGSKAAFTSALKTSRCLIRAFLMALGQMTTSSVLH